MLFSQSCCSDDGAKIGSARVSNRECLFLRLTSFRGCLGRLDDFEHVGYTTSDSIFNSLPTGNEHNDQQISRETERSVAAGIDHFREA
jgi:hypothetical protein